MAEEICSCLRGEGLTKIFGIGRKQCLAVDHVDFDFSEGEIVSIVGESGSGKTTLAKMLLGLISTTEGEIYLQGQEAGYQLSKKEKGILEEYPGNLPGSVLLPTIFSARLMPCCWIVLTLRDGKNLTHEQKVALMTEACSFVNLKFDGVDQQVSV